MVEAMNPQLIQALCQLADPLINVTRGYDSLLVSWGGAVCADWQSVPQHP